MTDPSDHGATDASGKPGRRPGGDVVRRDGCLALPASVRSALDEVTNLGGVCERGVTRRTNYLVIGTFGSRDCDG